MKERKTNVSYGGSRSLPPVNKQTENVKLSFHTARIWSFNGSYANRESGMEQAQRIPRPLTNRSPTKWVRFGKEEQRSEREMAFDAKHKKAVASDAKLATTMEAPPRLELGSRGFAVRCLTTWLWRHMRFAGDG